MAVIITLVLWNTVSEELASGAAYVMGGIILIGMINTSMVRDAAAIAAQDVVYAEAADARARARAIVDAKVAKAAKIKAELDAIAAEKKAEEDLKTSERQKALDKTLTHLQNSLPFYTRNVNGDHSEYNGDDQRWWRVVNAIKEAEPTMTRLYLVKVKDLDTNEEHYKIGVTRQSIADRFLKSPDLELEEIIYSYELDARLALFAEFHFIREFRPTNNPSENDARFSGYTEVIKKNSIRKIKSLMSRLPEYVAKAEEVMEKKLSNNKEK